MLHVQYHSCHDCCMGGQPDDVYGIPFPHAPLQWNALTSDLNNICFRLNACPNSWFGLEHQPPINHEIAPLA